jgi:hypothetical protein
VQFSATTPGDDARGGRRVPREATKNRSYHRSARRTQTDIARERARACMEAGRRTGLAVIKHELACIWRSTSARRGALGSNRNVQGRRVRAPRFRPIALLKCSRSIERRRAKRGISDHRPRRNRERSTDAARVRVAGATASRSRHQPLLYDPLLCPKVKTTPRAYIAAPAGPHRRAHRSLTPARQRIARLSFRLRRRRRLQAHRNANGRIDRSRHGARIFLQEAEVDRAAGVPMNTGSR